MWQLIIVLCLAATQGQACMPLQGSVVPANADGFVSATVCNSAGKVIAAQLATNPAVQNTNYSCSLPK